MKTFARALLLCFTAMCSFLPGALGEEKKRYFVIQVVDAQTGRGVPLIELQTVNNIRYYTDSNGIVAFDEPGLMGTKVYFYISGHGYEYPADGFGYRGAGLTPEAGKSATLKINRVNVAERLYRISGAGIYRDSILAGREVPIQEPLLNSHVLGLDSVLTEVYDGKVFWIWGDTNKPGYILGNFNATCATSLLPKDGGLDPDRGVDLKYFSGPDGFVKGIAPVPGKGPTWLGGLVALPDEKGRERLCASYIKTENLMPLETGFVMYNDEQQVFEKIAAYDVASAVAPGEHPLRATVDAVDYVYFGNCVRVPATVRDYLDLSKYEAYTCLKEGTNLSLIAWDPFKGFKDPKAMDGVMVDRDESGKVRYSWKKNTSPMSIGNQKKLLAGKKITETEKLYYFQNPADGKGVMEHGYSLSWNSYRKRWIKIFLESWGSSALGEIWYAEADHIEGPWVYARKIVTHDKYTFYNPRHHPMFDKDGGRTIYFEGTYTTFMVPGTPPTPRYNYNQIMYKLDLAGSRLALPVPVYALDGRDATNQLGTIHPTGDAKAVNVVAFFAPDLPGEGTIPVYSVDGALSLTGAKDAAPVFYALAPDAKDPPKTAVPLYEFAHASDPTRVYTTRKDWSGEGFKLVEKPVCLVWKNPMGFYPPPASAKAK